MILDPAKIVVTSNLESFKVRASRPLKTVQLDKQSITPDKVVMINSSDKSWDYPFLGALGDGKPQPVGLSVQVRVPASAWLTPSAYPEARVGFLQFALIEQGMLNFRGRLDSHGEISVNLKAAYGDQILSDPREGASGVWYQDPNIMPSFPPIIDKTLDLWSDGPAFQLSTTQVNSITGELNYLSAVKHVFRAVTCLIVETGANRELVKAFSWSVLVDQAYRWDGYMLLNAAPVVDKSDTSWSECDIGGAFGGKALQELVTSAPIGDHPFNHDPYLGKALEFKSPFWTQRGQAGAQVGFWTE